MEIKLDLQRFTEGGGAGAAAGGDAGTGVTGADAGSQRAEGTAQAAKPVVVYGKQEAGEAPAAVDAGQQAEAEGPDRNAEWQRLISGEYKEQFQRQVQGIIDKRFARYKGMEETAGKTAALLEKVAARYGLDSGDLDKIGQAIDSDAKFLQDQADKAGMTVDQYRQYSQALRENRAYRQEAENRQRDAAVQQQIAQWQQQAAQVKQMYPSFDMDTEMRNPAFVSMLKSGVDMRTAFQSAHFDELMRGGMQYATAAAQAQTARNIAARGQRPMEGAAGGNAAVVTKSDVTKLSKADREEIARQVMRGKKITFS